MWGTFGRLDAVSAWKRRDPGISCVCPTNWYWDSMASSAAKDLHVASAARKSIIDTDQPFVASTTGSRKSSLVAKCSQSCNSQLAQTRAASQVSACTSAASHASSNRSRSSTNTTCCSSIASSTARKSNQCRIGMILM